MRSKQDRRVERTKRDLKNALLYLIEEKRNINSITITDIAEYANYNRTTFYAHYSDKESLLNEIKEDAITGFIESFRDPYKDKKRILHVQQLKSSAIKIFEYVEKNSSLFLLLFNNSVFPGFQQQLCDALEKVFDHEIEFIGEHFQNMNKELYSRIEAYSMIGMLDFWVTNAFNYSSNYMTEQLIQKIHYSPVIIKIKNHD